MRKLGYITIVVLAVIAVFLWSAGRVTRNNNNLQSTGPEYGVGGGPGFDLSKSGNQTTIDESVKLNALMQEHAINASFHLQDFYDGKDTGVTSGKLQQNSIEVARFFERKIGVDENSFLSMWDAHIREYENYVNALKNNDRTGTAEARSSLNNHSTMMGAMINRAKPNIPTSEVARLMNEHVDLTLSVIEAHAKGDTAEKLSQSSKASAQAVAFADALIDAIEGETATPRGAQ